MSHAREANVIIHEYVGCWLIRLTIWAVPSHGDERPEPVSIEKWVDLADHDDGDLAWAIEALRRGLSANVSALYSED